MPSASIKKKIHCSKEQLIEMVLDIENYPSFVPWCIEGKIDNRVIKDKKIEIIADLTIGKSFFRETYKSLVIYDKSSNYIKVSNIGGPLKYFENKWFFKEEKDYCNVEFYIDFELKNKILNLVLKKYFNIGLKKISDAFEKRAINLFNKR